MKSIRRSLKGDKDSKPPPHLSTTPKNITAFPPKKVIKALYDYEPQNTNSQELAFHKGDFFHVLSREDDAEWYEACNPLIPTARGLVPVAFFEVIGKQQRQSDNSIASRGERSEGNDSTFSEASEGNLQHNRSESSATAKPGHTRGLSMAGKNAGNMVYGVVQYDFNAERADELDAKAGEAIIVVAQSNPEWFVAKPIGRLGGPGLIPVAFVDVKDTATMQSVTDPLEAVRKAGVPRVEEWKKFAAEYKNSSISLGKFDNTQAQMSAEMGRMSLQNSGPPLNSISPNSFGQNASQTKQMQQPLLLAPISASVPRYCFDNDMYWFVIECQMEDGRWFELSRYYADFYDFQIALLENFPEEAGNRGKPRTLPYMPGPVAHVTDAISNGRRQNLDEYIKKIISMPPHISKSMLVRNLFKPKRGQDFEMDPNALGEDYRLSGGSQASLQQLQSNQGSLPTSSNLNSDSIYGGMSPGAAHNQQRGQSAGGPGMGYPGPNGSGHLLQNQASNLTEGSNSSSAKAGNNAGGGHLKIKVFFQQEIIAIRVPQNITFQALKEKLMERLKIDEDIVIQYKDEPSNSYMDMESDENLDVAVERNPKLALNVNYAVG